MQIQMSHATALGHVERLRQTAFLSDKQGDVVKEAQYACSVIADTDFIFLTPTEHRLLTAPKGLQYR